MGDSDRGVAIALLAPAFNDARDMDAKRRKAMQVASLLVEIMGPWWATTSPSTTTPSTPAPSAT